MHISTYLGRLSDGERELADAFGLVAARHEKESEVRERCKMFAGWSGAHGKELEPFVKKYGQEQAPAVEMLRSALFADTRRGGLGKLLDLQDLGVLANAVRTDYTVLIEGAAAIQDTELQKTCERLGQETNRQIDWLCTQIKVSAAQALTVEEGKAPA